MTNQQIEKFASQILRTQDFDTALALLERITTAARTDTIEDVLIELSYDESHADAADLIRQNF